MTVLMHLEALFQVTPCIKMAMPNLNRYPLKGPLTYLGNLRVK